jgi:hypothetical protein
MDSIDLKHLWLGSNRMLPLHITDHWAKKAAKLCHNPALVAPVAKTPLQKRQY